MKNLLIKLLTFFLNFLTNTEVKKETIVKKNMIQLEFDFEFSLEENQKSIKVRTKVKRKNKKIKSIQLKFDFEDQVTTANQEPMVDNADQKVIKNTLQMKENLTFKKVIKNIINLIKKYWHTLTKNKI